MGNSVFPPTTQVQSGPSLNTGNLRKLSKKWKKILQALILQQILKPSVFSDPTIEAIT